MAATNKPRPRGKRAPLDRTKQRRRAKAKRKIDPIPESYGPFRRACKALNDKLFGGQLPPCLVTLQRKKRALGFFSGRRFRSADGAIVTDEIALNPAHFAERGARKVLSTLAHELAHQWQQHYGRPSRTGYHNEQWAAKMREIGLIPSHNGRPGGKQTGQRMTHFIKRGGPFDRVARALVAKGFALAYVERNSKAERKVALKKQQSKTRYNCEGCGLNAWAKPGVNLICGTCHKQLVP
ncbi:MAG: SprT-like domain-containing protein [Bradyrhizobium sp.]